MRLLSWGAGDDNFSGLQRWAPDGGNFVHWLMHSFLDNGDLPADIGSGFGRLHGKRFYSRSDDRPERSILVWDLETIPDLAAARMLDMTDFCTKRTQGFPPLSSKDEGFELSLTEHTRLRLVKDVTYVFLFDGVCVLCSRGCGS